MKSKANISGHPIHPMLVTIPIGLWVMSLVGDLAYLSVGLTFWYDLAWWTMLGGLVGALAAAIPGAIDYFGTARQVARAEPTARTHAFLNLGVVVLYAINLYLRRGYNASSGNLMDGVVLLSVVGIAALCVSGWLGGDLVYRYGLGMKRRDLRVSMMEAERETTKLNR